MMNNLIYKLFREEIAASHFKRINDSENLHIYVGKDERSRFAFQFTGDFIPIRVNSSELISVDQYKDEYGNTICFALENSDLLERFSIFCQDLLDSTTGLKSANEGYSAVCNRYYSWKKLFKPNEGHLSEPQIMGLIGELLFLKDELMPHYGMKAMAYWIGPEKTHKDFSFDDTWAEVKTINFGKDTVTISSIEQLDGEKAGTLAVYQLERMGTDYNGIMLNSLVNDLLNEIGEPVYRDIFMSKLTLYGYDGSPEYDNAVFEVKGFMSYI